MVQKTLPCLKYTIIDIILCLSTADIYILYASIDLTVHCSDGPILHINIRRFLYEAYFKWNLRV